VISTATKLQDFQIIPRAAQSSNGIADFIKSLRELAGPDHDASPQGHEEQGGRQPPHIDSSIRPKGVQMLFAILQTITDFAVLLMRLTTEELSDKQRMVMIDQFIHLQGLDVVFQFDLHGLLMILITILIIVFWRAWDRVDRWLFH